jgi:dihydropyrimidinase
VSVELVVRDGTLVTPNDKFAGDLLVDGGLIAGVVEPGTAIDADETVNASGQLVLPGVVDPHVHVAGPNTIDDYEDGSRAAALGGVTSFISFAWQAWDGPDSPFSHDGTLQEAVDRQSEAGADSVVDFGVHGTITRDDPAVLEEIAPLVESGTVSFKLFTTYSFGLRNGFIERIFEEIAAADGVAVLHTEDDDVCSVRETVMRAEGRGDPADYPDSRPAHAEAMAADDAIRMAQQAGVKYYGIHTSCRDAAEVIAAAQTDKSQFRGETCTHYTTLDRSAYETQGLLPMIAPPLRSADDVDGIFEHLRRGTLDVVSTDHVAFTEASKQTENWWDSEYGANGIQRSLPVFHDEAVNRRGMSYPKLVRLMCSNPAKIFGLTRKGTLEPGTDADFVLFDPDEAHEIDSVDNASRADYSIYDEREVVGTVKRTYLRGECIAADGEIVGESGYGEPIDRIRPDWSE